MPVGKYCRNPANWKTEEKRTPSGGWMLNEMRRFSDAVTEQMFGAVVVNFGQLQPAWHS